LADGLDPAALISALSATTFVLGLLIGIVIKRTVKLVFAIVALVIILSVTGYISLGLSEPTALIILRVADQASQEATRVADLARLLPLSSAAFLIGAALGFWKG